MLSERFDRALTLASTLHREQKRKGGEIPYVAHLLGVAALVLEAGGGEDEAIAALLHDAVEDQGGAPTLDEIRRLFGARVAEIVAGCTDTDQSPKPPWRARKTAFLAAIAAADDSIRLVVAADKLHNASATLVDLREHGPEIWERLRGRENAMWYFRSIVEALASRGKNRLTRQLERVVSELETL